MSDIYMTDIVERLRDPRGWSDRADMLEAADEITRLRAATQWRPIESAPKDGTWFVIVNEDDGADSFEIGCYSPLIWHDFEPVADGLFRKTEREIYEWRGFNNMHRATHWLPLPPPPAINKEGGE